MERSFRAVVISFTSKARSSANCAKSTHGKKTGGEGRGGGQKRTEEGEKLVTKRVATRNQRGGRRTRVHGWLEEEGKSGRTENLKQVRNFLIRRNCVN